MHTRLPSAQPVHLASFTNSQLRGPCTTGVTIYPPRNYYESNYSCILRKSSTGRHTNTASNYWKQVNTRNRREGLLLDRNVPSIARNYHEYIYSCNICKSSAIDTDHVLHATIASVSGLATFDGFNIHHNYHEDYQTRK